MRTLLSVLVLLLAAPAAFAAERVNLAEVGASFVVPDGFVDQGAPNTYVRGTPEDANFAMVQLHPLGGTIGREPLAHDQVEKVARATAEPQGVHVDGFEYRKTKWKEFELEQQIMRTTAGDRKLLVMSTQVPLAKQAVQLQVMGPTSEEKQLQQLFDASLAGLDGKSNWLTEDEKSQKVSSLIGTGVGVVLGLAIVLWWTRRKSRA